MFYISYITYIYINYKLIVSPCSARLEIKAQRNWVIYPLWQCGNLASVAESGLASTSTSL